MTSLLTVHNDIMHSMDVGRLTALAHHKLSAPSDTFYHATLLPHHLEHWSGHSGASGFTTNWFQ